ncbi:alkylhydroperoxidase [Thermoleophilia bacterium SCSIO 60948]|nr:alkylhydroperoxidase [Thermoleophilia bacterium SCSIO 60948]
MTRLPDIDPSTATGAVRKTLDELAERSGPPGPMVRAMANSSALLRGYVDLNRAMKRSHLDRQVGERVSLAVQAWIGCDYCLAAHTKAAQRLGLHETDIDLARQGTAIDPKIAALVAFGQQLIAAPAEIADADIEALHDHGWRDEQLADVVGLVALNLMTGAFNLAAGIHSGVETAAIA